jgi:hypothetical protein
MYPLPAGDFITLNMGNFSGKKTMRFFDASGKLVLETFHTENNVTIDVSSFNNGLYQIMISDEKGLTGTNKLMVSGK